MKHRAFDTGRNEAEYILLKMEEERMERHASDLLDVLVSVLRERYGTVCIHAESIVMSGPVDDVVCEVQCTVSIPCELERTLLFPVGSVSTEAGGGWFSAQNPDEEWLEAVEEMFQPTDDPRQLKLFDA